MISLSPSLPPSFIFHLSPVVWFQCSLCDRRRQTQHLRCAHRTAVIRAAHASERPVRLLSSPLLPLFFFLPQEPRAVKLICPSVDWLLSGDQRERERGDEIGGQSVGRRRPQAQRCRRRRRRRPANEVLRPLEQSHLPAGHNQPKPLLTSTALTSRRIICITECALRLLPVLRRVSLHG